MCFKGNKEQFFIVSITIKKDNVIFFSLFFSCDSKIAAAKNIFHSLLGLFSLFVSHD